MRVLFVHHTFPAQFCHLAPYLAAQLGNEVIAVGERTTMIGLSRAPATEAPAFRPAAGVKLLGYDLPALEAQPGAIDFDLRRAIQRGTIVARGARDLSRAGFRPDVIIAHPAWGEALFLKDIFPESKLVIYCESYFRPNGGELGFDPEFPVAEDAVLRARIASAAIPLSIEAADWGMAPTQWQRSLFPTHFIPRISAIHDGIDTDIFTPARMNFRLSDGTTLSTGDEIITFAARNLEPHRGFHIFMRAIPEIQRRRPHAHIVVVGGDGFSYSPRLPGGETYRERLLHELDGRLDPERLHFCGWVSHQAYLALLRISAVHVYLVYPIGISWSLLEAMSAGCVVVASRTGPMEELIENGRNGWIVDFFSHAQIADRVDAVLTDAVRSAAIRDAARRTVVERYDAKRVCVPAQTALLEQIAAE